MAGCGWHFGLNATTHLSSYARRTIWFLLIFPFANAEPQSFDFGNFNSNHAKQLRLEGNASISGSGIQLSGNGPGSAGRVTYPQQIHLWDNSSKEQMDFTANFSFTVFAGQSPHGDGLAFFLASSNLPSVNNTAELKGGGLGIGLVEGNQHPFVSDYQFVAVEFDTFANSWDPDGAHVGVNINSMKSETVGEWWTDIQKKKVYYCNIEYDSRYKNLNVFFTGHRFKFNHDHVAQITQNLSYKIDIGEHLPDTVIVGISAATGKYFEEHTLLSWSFSTRLPINANPEKGGKINAQQLGGIAIGICLLLGLLWLVIVILRRMNKGNGEHTSEASSDLKMDIEFQMSTGLNKICYYELAAATNNFEEKLKLGQGGFGGVYKGYLKDSNTYAAIKRISQGSRQGLKQYEAEVMIIGQLRHTNLVKLIGWCHKKNDLLLIYEYMPNGSLDSHLFCGESILSWQVRYNIALGLASALLYLQEEWEKCVLHRDIKSSNILLDSNFIAKLGDFGLAKLVDHKKASQTTVVAGTIGYLAPEYISSGKARKESDIFSFGVVLLEVASGRKAIHYKDNEGEVSLVEWVWELYGLKNLLAAADPNLCGVYDAKQMEYLLVAGLWCANPDSISRPTVRQVIKVLNFEAPLPVLPQKIPVLAYICPITN